MVCRGSRRKKRKELGIRHKSWQSRPSNRMCFLHRRACEGFGRCSTFFLPFCFTTRSRFFGCAFFRSRFLAGFLYFRAVFFPEATIGKTLEVAVPNCPERPPDAAVARDLAEAYRRTKDMTDRIHPSHFASVVVRIHNGNPVVYFLKGEPMIWRRKYCLANKGGVGEVRFLHGIWSRWKGIWKVIVVIFVWEGTHRTGG